MRVAEPFQTFIEFGVSSVFQVIGSSATRSRDLDRFAAHRHHREDLPLPAGLRE